MPERDVNPRRIARWALIAGACFVTLVAVAAAGEAASVLVRFATGQRHLGWSGAGTLVMGIGGLLAAAWVAMAAPRSRLTDARLLALGLATVLVVRAAVVIAMDAPLAPDGVAYRDLARWLASGGCCFADRPTGYPAVLAVAYRLFGETSIVHEGLNVAAAVVGGWLLHDLARPALGRAAAFAGLIGYAVMPALVLLTPVLLTDSVYATIVIAIAWAASRSSGGSTAWAVATGLLLAVSQYVRPVAPALLPAVALVPLAFARPWSRALIAVAAMAATFAVAMLPVVAYNLDAHGEPSVSTSAFGGWSLYMGTNQGSNGRYNDADAAFMHALPGDTFWEQSDEAGRLGVQRITSDPIGFTGLAVRKFAVMWGTEEHAVIFAFRPEGRATGALAGIDLLAQLAWLAITLLAAAGVLLALRRGPPHPALLAALLLLLAEAAVHTFLEVKPRYHAHAEPLFLLAAAAAATAALDRWWPRAGRRSGSGSSPAPSPRR